MLELLSPCGSEKSFFAAINNCANAVYLGLDDFSARKNAENFSREDLPFYLDYAHVLGVKVYVALNTLVKDGELEKFFEYAAFCNSVGADGLIIQDVFLGKPLKERFPDLPLHLSTQAGVNNEDGARLAVEFGFSRAVLARETPLEEIKKISEIIETECFIQGALCTAFSGQCYASGFSGNMSGNRGVCKQPCRKKYVLKNGNERREGYSISLSDLSVGKDISAYIEAGVTSFKIEGRMRKPSFVAAATRYYRDILDKENPSISPLKRTFNRGDYTKGLSFKQDENLISDKIQSHKGEFIGKIRSVSGDLITADRPIGLSSKDAGKIIRDGFEVGSFICDGKGLLRANGSFRPGDDINVTTDTALEKRLAERRLTLDVEVTARLISGEKPVLSAKSGDTIVRIEGEDVLEKAKNAPMTKNDVVSALNKVDDLPFGISPTVICDDVFIAKSKLNELRRRLYEKTYRTLSFRPSKREFDAPPIKPKGKKSRGVIVLDDDFSFIDDYRLDIAVFCPSDYGDNRLIDGFFEKTAKSRCKKYLYIPNKFSSADEKSVSDIFSRFDGFYVDGTFGAELAKRYKKDLVLGTGANVYNQIDCALSAGVSDKVCLSKELSLKEAEDLDGYYYSLGSIKLMDLLYCPFKKTCKNCRRNDISTLYDGEREFIVRRVKLNGCRFEVYNCAALVTENRERAIVNLVTLPKEKKLPALLSLGDKAALKKLFKDHTSGHEKKPLI